MTLMEELLDELPSFREHLDTFTAKKEKSHAGAVDILKRIEAVHKTGLAYELAMEQLAQTLADNCGG